MPATSYSFDQAANKIATTGRTGAYSTPITYGFRASDMSNAAFVQFTSPQIEAAEEALRLWSDVANIRFQRVGSGTSGSGAYSNTATMLFSGDTTDGGYAWAYFPGIRTAAEIDGDVFINPSYGSFSSLPSGSYEFMSIVHEIGHAIGLDHPGAYNGGNPSYSVDAEYVQDSMQYTLMSYFEATNTGANHGDVYASTPLLHDIAAAQLMYGANWSTRSGNTVYGFHSNADRDQFHIDSYNEKAVFAVWDGGGNDTLDFSGYANAQSINLNAAGFSSVGGLKGNVAIARGAVIENAIGGAGTDTIFGNTVANRLSGLAGNDTLNGAAGNDMLSGGLGNDTLAGGVGADGFCFNTALNSVANVDRIMDFDAAADTVRLENAVFRGLGAAVGFLTSGAFYTGASAHDSNDRIIYNKATGNLFYDADGTGGLAPIKFATLIATVKPVLDCHDFVVI